MFISFATRPAELERENEDFFAATSTVAVLVDGERAPTGAMSGCSHGVAWFVRELGVRCLEAAANESVSLTDALRTAIYHVAGLHGHTCDLSHPVVPSAGVAMVREHRGQLEHLVLADAVLVARGASGTRAITDHREATFAEQYRPLLGVLSQTGKTHNVAVKTYVEMLREHRNHNGGFWIASADPDAADHAITGVLHPTEAQVVAVLSNGASRPVVSFDLLSWDYAIEELAAGGPKRWLSRVRRAEDEDPHATRWPRTDVHAAATAAITLPDWV
ncbi:MAG TPA: hypothetical protein VEX15_09640 [Nocardioidaceae bacterium]|nr:hypothetical protein [Nocardioidaceae bacterium]